MPQVTALRVVPPAAPAGKQISVPSGGARNLAALDAALSHAMAALHKAGVVWIGPSRLVRYAAYIQGVKSPPEQWTDADRMPVIEHLSRMTEFATTYPGQYFAEELQALNGTSHIGDVLAALTVLGYDVRTAIAELDALLYNTEALQQVIGAAGRHASACLFTLKGAGSALRNPADFGA